MSNPLISPDGTDWYECPRERFATLLDRPDFDCWVDLSGKETGVCHVTLSAVRKMIASGEASLDTLYGLPIVYAEEKEARRAPFSLLGMPVYFAGNLDGGYGTPIFGSLADIGKLRKQ